MECDEDIVPEWVVHNLRLFGNCSIGKNRVDKYGANKILNILNKLNIKCQLDVYKKIFTEPDFLTGSLKDREEWFCILRMI